MTEMGSNQNDGTSYQPSESKPCENNCGFFGSAGTKNLCSKCYRDVLIQEEQAALARSAMEKSISFPPKSKPKPFEFGRKAPNHKLLAALSATSSTDNKIFNFAPFSASSSAAGPSKMLFGYCGDGSEAPPRVPNRCWSCNKKVGLNGFSCRCGKTFCGTHRHAEKHDCTFDFKKSGRQEIAKANPLVKSDKLQRF